MKQETFNSLTQEQKNIYCYIEDTISEIDNDIPDKTTAIDMIFNKVKDYIK